MANKIKFKINNDKFSSLIERLDDLTKIDDTIKMKIDSEHILIYSMLSSGQTMLAFKNYLLNTKEYLEVSDELEFSYDIIIANAKKFVKNLNFIKESQKVTLEVGYKPSTDDDNIWNARSLQIVGGKLKVNWLTGEHYEMRDINKNILKQRLDLKNKKWSFKISQSDFNDIKKLSNINSERIINVTVTNGTVLFSERAAWELEIDKLDQERNSNLILNKKFLSCINDSNEVEVNIFDSFMLIKDENSNLMLSFEQDFSEDE